MCSGRAKSEKGVALSDRHCAEFSGPGVYVLENMLMDMSQMIRVKGSANRVFVKFEESCEEMVTFKLVQTICIANVC
jgi:hypothetical protein